MATAALNEMVRAQDNIGKFDTLFIKKSGEIVGVNKRRLYETPFALCTNPPYNDVDVVAAISSGATAMRVSAEGPMQLTQLGAVRDATHGACLVRLYMRDGSGVNMMMNSPCHIDTIFGIGGQMYPLPEAIYIDEDRAMSVIFTNLNGLSATHGRILAFGAKYSQLQMDPSLQRVKQRLQKSQFLSAPYFYTFDDGSILVPACGTVQAEIVISNAHNFEIHQFSIVRDGTVNIDIVDLTKGESIINAPRGTHYALPDIMFCGNNYYPYRLHEPVIVFSGQRLLVTLTDTSNTQGGNRVYLTLGGKALKVRQWS